MSVGRRILIVDDEPRMLELLTFALEAAGYEVRTASDAESAWQLVGAEPLALVVLDVMLPGPMSGVELCRRVREASDLPIILLTALGADGDRVRGLEAGADDYVVKPFSPRELVLRIGAVLRRAAAGPATASGTERTVGELHLDAARTRALSGGRDLHLSPSEFKLLWTLAEQPGRTVGWADLSGALGQASGQRGGRHAVRTAIYRLRGKLGDDPHNPRHILSDHGRGYRLVPR